MYTVPTTKQGFPFITSSTLGTRFGDPLGDRRRKEDQLDLASNSIVTCLENVPIFSMPPSL